MEDLLVLCYTLSQLGSRCAYIIYPGLDSVHVKHYNKDTGNCKRCTGIIMQALAKYSKQVYRAVIKMQVKQSNVGDL